jgi:hypothetical protein
MLGGTETPRISRLLLVVALTQLVFLMALTSCGASDSNGQSSLDEPETERIAAELEGRSFRQFDPSVDANKRKGVILDFFNGIELWAQYAEGTTALNEWSITAEDYRIEKSDSEYRIYFEAPRSEQILPTQCHNCIETTGISISIRDLFDSKKIRFKLNIGNNDFPRPFPIFESWTEFREDEYFD